jgi:hypothetical protein
VNYESPEAYLARVGAIRLTSEPAKPNGHDERNPPPPGEAATPQGPRTDENVLLLSAWVKRDLPLRRFLLGNVICTTSRWLVYGETGVGKTLVAADIAAAIAAGDGFLNWEGSGEPARVMYLDGEMPAETFKERMEVIAKRYGPDIAFYGYNRDVLGDGEMPPLNTPEGEKWLWREIEAVKPDLIVFDSIMCLLAGSMSEEESWAPVKVLVRKISSRRIAQIWLHHTGHDTTKGFGTKTREWEMDTVVALTKPAEDDGSISMEFKKARLRTPENRQQFEPRSIRLEPDGWTSEGMAKASSGKRSSEVEQIAKAILAAYDRLADAVEASTGFDGKPVRKVKSEAVRDEVKSRGFLDKTEGGGVTATSRKYYHRAKTDLVSRTTTLVEKNDLMWRP